MNGLLWNILAVVFGAGVAFFTLVKVLGGTRLFNLEKRIEHAKEMVEKSEEEAKQIKEKSTKQVSEIREKSAAMEARKNERIKKNEELLKGKEKNLNKKSQRNSELKKTLSALEEELKRKRGESETLEKQLVEKLANKIGGSLESKKKEIITRYEKEIELDMQEKLAKLEENTKEKADRVARRAIVNVMQRLITATSVETRAVGVKVPKDQQKGKIVGKAACNIELLESLLDVYIVFNDLPNTIHVSAFNLVQRRIAQKALEKLVKVRGVIDAKVIKEMVSKATKETDEELYGIGKKALDRMGMKHEDKDFVRIVGRLQYRTSYGQNIMKHSMEVGWLSAMLGAEIGLDEETCKVGGFLHDLGKAIDQDPEITDPHDLLSKKLMEKYNFSWEATHAAWTHHDAIPQETPEAIIVKAADAISASRPGARQESIQRYIERIKALEETGKAFGGVKKTFAISAGRELRVIVEPREVTDKMLHELAKNVAEKIETDLAYPGKIKVNVIRRTKHIELAK